MLSRAGPPRRLLVALAFGGAAASGASAQSRPAVLAERAAFADWLRGYPLSPRRTVVVRPIGPALTLGPGTADVPLDGVPAATLRERDGRVTLTTGDGERPLARGREISLGAWRLVVSGPPGRAVVSAFGAAPRVAKEVLWYPYDSRAVYPVTLAPPASPAVVRLLGPDGVEVDATEAGTVAPALPGGPRTLRVRRLPGSTEEETELEIYFRDGSSGRGTYPAGRFVSLIPQGGGRYLLDFNRARNPWCAYNTVYPCPAPWAGNALEQAVRAGERYEGGGLDVPKPY